MRATLHEIISTDVDVETFRPDDPADAGVWVRLLVGPAQQQDDEPLSGESFDVLVCTPLWLRREVVENGPQIGRHHLVVEPFDLPRATAYLRELVESLDEADWDALAEKLARIGHWEFEDYQE
ncbi:Imm8 family immunity protein [Cellulomonas composti]|uniref:Uncharacterized protein n=1 Tax=Cellulomonas composti TaxID=266130 RepID=A0A511JEF2_9CELL|nr:Imm8 family immunity protein [Cellulomonas composti]GEL96380.1 hypothetical protein CCO02nite_30380 [Cellulomonas composti]